MPTALLTSVEPLCGIEASRDRRRPDPSRQHRACSESPEQRDVVSTRPDAADRCGQKPRGSRDGYRSKVMDP